MSIETMTKLASTTVGVGGSASVVFSNIPQNYTDLCIKISCQTNRSADEGGLSVQLNSATTGQTYRVLAGLGSNGTNSVDTAYEPLWVCRIQGGTAGTNVFSNTDLYIPNYAGNKPKVILADSATEKNASIAYITLSSVVQANSSPVTSLTLSGLGGTLQQHSTFTVYGIKNVRQTVGNSIKATGGNIVFDGTYVYHVFNSTDNFIPTSALNIDYLVVAGGGSGANSVGYSECSGGGGAGGYRTTVGTSGGGSSAESKISVSPIPYLVTIGAGGAGKSTYGAGNQGNNSAFHTVVSRAGGAAGADGGGSAGGSGGGAGTSGGVDRIAGLGTAGQGYDGGPSKAVASPSNSNAGGGGGGAGGVGVAGASGVAGNGGPGLTAFDGNIYAGGGGGNTFGSGGVQGSGGSGIGGAGISTGTSGNGGSGRVNTGSGGGASGASGSVSGAGASGVVIIRYKG
jgi:hypothetical protein